MLLLCMSQIRWQSFSWCPWNERTSSLKNENKAHVKTVKTACIIFKYMYAWNLKTGNCKKKTVIRSLTSFVTRNACNLSAWQLHDKLLPWNNHVFYSGSRSLRQLETLLQSSKILTVQTKLCDRFLFYFNGWRRSSFNGNGFLRCRFAMDKINFRWCSTPEVQKHTDQYHALRDTKANLYNKW